MEQPRRELLSRDFLWNRALVDRLVRASSLSHNDLVLEIGPGRGIITRALLQAPRRVIAVGVDPRLCAELRRCLPDPRLELMSADFLCCPLPREPYKVFASIPYRITSEILRKLLLAPNPPADCALVVQREAAEKFIVQPRVNTMAAVLHHPWWEIRVTHTFARADFRPAPRVDSVLLCLTRREQPLLAPRLAPAYRDYVAFCFTRDRNARARSPGQFVEAFRALQRQPGQPALRLFAGAFQRLLAQQDGLQKIHRSRTDPNWRKRAGK